MLVLLKLFQRFKRFTNTGENHVLLSTKLSANLIDIVMVYKEWI